MMLKRTGSWAAAATLAGVLLGAAHAPAQPERTRTLTHDPKKKEWVESPPPPPGTPEGDLHRIRVAINEERYAAARKTIAAFIKQYRDSHALYPEALLAQAESHLGRKHYDEAHAVLQRFLNQFAGIHLTSEALRLEFEVAEAYLAGAKRKLLGMRILPARDLGYRILDEISATYTDSEYAELAIKTKADHMFNKGDFGLAELEYGRLLQEYPKSRYRQHALRRSAEAALAGFGGVHYDDAALIEAQDRFRQYQSRYPAAAKRDDIDAVLGSIEEMQAEKHLRIADYYERTEHFASAIFYYRMVRNDWPQTIAAGKAAERLELLGVLEPAAAPSAEEGP